VHLVSDVPVHIRSILYVPAHLDLGPLRSPTDSGLRLYSKKILIQENNTDLLPNYLRFVEGVVDSEDLPLNISRETVQSTRVMRQIERSLTTRMIKAFSELATEQPDDYVQFWGEFGVFLKQGIATDPFIYDDLLPLLRFYSSKSGDELISLGTYAARMQEEQPAIYYILGEDLESVKRSPHLDYFRQHDVEVLYLVDPLDGLTMQSLREFEGKPFQSVESADLEVPEEKESEEREMTLPQDEFDALVGRFKAILGDRIKEIRESKVLRDSPCRLVSPGGGAERDLQRVRRLLGEKYEIPPRILEINRGHPLIGQLARMVKKGASPGVVEAAIEQLFANQLLLEGTLPNPAEMVPRIQTLLEAATLSEEN
ncbi:MAG: molecular chaperone HtpG, partial [Anaerolineae bacterium]